MFSTMRCCRPSRTLVSSVRRWCAAPGSSSFVVALRSTGGLLQHRCGSASSSSQASTLSAGSAPVPVAGCEATKLKYALGRLIARSPSTEAAQPSRRRSGRRRRSENAATEADAMQVVPDEAVAKTEVSSRPTHAAQFSEQLAFWSSAAPAIASNPTQGLIERQQHEFLERLVADRKLKWYRDKQAANRELEAALRPVEPKPPPVDNLQPEVVKEIFDSLVQDPERDLVERRQERIRERMCLHLEQVLTIAPPVEVSEAMAGAGVRIVRMESADLTIFPAPHTVRFRVLTGEDPLKVQRRLDSVAPLVSRALARSSLLALAPVLRFRALEPAEALEAEKARQPQLWRHSKLERRRTVHSAMSSWKADMHWSSR